MQLSVAQATPQWSFQDRPNCLKGPLAYAEMTRCIKTALCCHIDIHLNVLLVVINIRDHREHLVP